MSGIVVHLPEGNGTDAVTLRLGPGERARFGRGSVGTPVELRLGDETVSRLAGEIHATDDHWQLSNLSNTHAYLVENPEGAGEYLRVPPRRVGAPIPFEFSPGWCCPRGGKPRSPSRCSRPTTSTWTRTPAAVPRRAAP
ncbi:hypothetical protein GCM10010440_06570 [Kitasatospora cinereorecta]